MAAPDAELVAAVEEDVRDGDLGGQHDGLWYGSEWSSVRKLIRFVRCAAAAKSASGLAEIENFGKKKCSITA